MGKFPKARRILDIFLRHFGDSIPISYRGTVCRIVISNDLVSRAESGSGRSQGGPWPNSIYVYIYIYIELPLRRFLDFRAVAASTGRLPLAWEESRPPTGVLEDAESRAAAAAAFINYRTRAVCRWNALRRSSAPNASTPMHAKTPLVRATVPLPANASALPDFHSSRVLRDLKCVWNSYR